jgi:hypothetical protein
MLSDLKDDDELLPKSAQASPAEAAIDDYSSDFPIVPYPLIKL